MAKTTWVRIAGTKYVAYHVWLRVKGPTADERHGARLTREEADQGWEWDFVPEQDGSIRIERLSSMQLPWVHTSKDE